MNERTLSRESVAIIALGALAVFALALLSPAIFNDGDTYWHIRAGQWMLAHRAVLTSDPFSLSFAGHPWQTQEWLAEIAFASAFQIAGWSGVAILTGVAMAATAALLAAYLVRRLGPVAAIVLLVLALGCVMPDFLARPHILALPFMTGWIIGLAHAVETRRAPHWILLLVMAFWVNLHGSFMFGVALIIPFAVEAVLADREKSLRTAANWALFMAAAIGVTLLNPHGPGGLLFPFHLMELKSLRSIGEWQSPDLQALGPVEIAFFAAVFFFIWRGVRIPATRLVVLLALAILWLEHARYGMLLGITGAVLTALPLSRTLNPGDAGSQRRGAPAIALAAYAAMFVAIAAFRVAWPVQRVDASAPALASVPSRVAALPVFNDYAFGGLLIFDGIRPLVDSRADLYGDAWLDQYTRAINADESTVNRVFRQYRVAWTMLKPDDPLVSALDRRPGWRRIYADAHAVIQAGPEALAALAHCNQMSSAPPPRFGRSQT